MSFKLEWNSASDPSFKMEFYPYFRGVRCSVSSCNETSNHICKYSLSNKIFVPSDRKMRYLVGSIREFYLCDKHARSNFLDLEYDSKYIVMK